MRNVKTLVLRVARCCIVRSRRVRTASEVDTESAEQFEESDLYTRTADAGQINVYVTVEQINVEISVALFVLVIEVYADACFEAFENCVDVKISEIDLGNVLHAHRLQVESCFDVEFEAVVHLVGEHKVESQTLEQIADAELVLDDFRFEFFVVGVDADLRKHRIENALQAVHSENEIEQFVECETVTDITSVVVLHESAVVVERISVLRREGFESLLVRDENVRRACIVVYDKTEVKSDNMRFLKSFIVTSVCAVVRFDVFSRGVKSVSVALVGALFGFCKFDELVDTLASLVLYRAVCAVFVFAGCDVDIADIHAECDEFAVNVDIERN